MTDGPTTLAAQRLRWLVPSLQTWLVHVIGSCVHKHVVASTPSEPWPRAGAHRAGRNVIGGRSRHGDGVLQAARNGGSCPSRALTMSLASLCLRLPCRYGHPSDASCHNTDIHLRQYSKPGLESKWSSCDRESMPRRCNPLRDGSSRGRRLHVVGSSRASERVNPSQSRSTDYSITFPRWSSPILPDARTAILEAHHVASTRGLACAPRCYSAWRAPGHAGANLDTRGRLASPAMKPGRGM